MANWQASKISKIEHAVQAPTVDDVKVWCRHCDTEDQLADLLASLDVVEGMYVEWRAVERSGMRAVQESSIPLYERTQLFRVYEPAVIPGLLQTRDYATARMRRIAEFSGIPDDVDEAVQVRMDRQRVLSTGARLVAVLEEAALYSRIGTRQTLADQLVHLAGAAMRPNVSLGIVPLLAERSMWSGPGFWIFNNELVTVETQSAGLTITQPSEISVYARTFRQLSTMAVRGTEARSLIFAAIDKLAVEQ